MSCLCLILKQQQRNKVGKTSHFAVIVLVYLIAVSSSAYANYTNQLDPYYNGFILGLQKLRCLFVECMKTDDIIDRETVEHRIYMVAWWGRRDLLSRDRGCDSRQGVSVQ